MGLVPKYNCLLDIQTRFLLFFLTSDKNEQTTWIIYPLNYLLLIGLVLTISKMFKFLSTLPVWEWGIPW